MAQGPPCEVLLLLATATQIAFRIYGDGFMLEAAALLAFFLASLCQLTFSLFAHWHHYKLREDGTSKSGIILGMNLPLFVAAAKLHYAHSHEPAQEVDYFRFYLWMSLGCSLCATIYSLFMSLNGPSKGGAAAATFTFKKDPLFMSLLVATLLPFLMKPLFPGMAWAKVAFAFVLFCLFLWIMLVRFPHSFTFGEAVILAQGLSLHIMDSLYYTFSLLQFNSLEPFLAVPRDEVSHFLTALIPGMLLCGAIVSVTVRRSAASTARWSRSPLSGHDMSKSPFSSSEKRQEWQLAIGFYAGMVGLVLFLVHPWLAYCLHGRDPFIWTLRFVFEDGGGRFLFCIFWVALLGSCLLAIHKARLLFHEIPNILVRKYFHALTVVLFVPAILYQYRFLQLSFGVALSGLIFVEFLRLGKILPFGELIDKFMRSFTDERDSGPLILTHLYLLIGCASPVWLLSETDFVKDNSSNGVLFMLPFVGVLIIGVGDSVASLAGMRLGRTRWPHSKKTVEGTAAAIAAVLLCGLALSTLTSAGSSISLTQWLGFLWATVCTCLLEAFTTQIDNLVLPLYYFSVLIFSV